MHADLPRFTGSVEHALDDKGRLIVPARFRERLGTGFVLEVTPSTAGGVASTWMTPNQRTHGLTPCLLCSRACRWYVPSLRVSRIDPDPVAMHETQFAAT